MENINTNCLTVINKHNKPSYGNPIEVMAEVHHKYTNKSKQDFTVDKFAKPSFSRPPLPTEILFPAINLREINDVYVYDAFLTFDKNHIYSDSSMRGGLAGASDESILTWARQKLQSSADNVSFEHSKEAVLIVHNEGGGTWGHHLIQNFPKILFAQKFFPDMKILLPQAFCSPNSSRGKLLDIYGVNRDKIVPIDPSVTYSFKSVYILDFLYDAINSFIHPWALNTLRSIVLKSAVTENRKLFVKRVGKRAIENQAVIEKCLLDKGYFSLTQNHQNLDEQILCWSSAGTVVATLGSDMSNLIFLKEGSAILSLSPDWFGDRFFYNLAYATNLNWYEIRCGEVGAISSGSHRFNNFHVDMNLLEETINRISTAQ